MAETADTLKRALVRASNKLLHHQKGHDGAQKEQDDVINQLASKGWLESVTKSLSEDISKRATVTTQTGSLPQAVTTPSLPASVVAGQSKGRADDLERTTQEL